MADKTAIYPPLTRKLHDAGYMLAEDVRRTMRVQRDRVAPLFEQIEAAADSD